MFKICSCALFITTTVIIAASLITTTLITTKTTITNDIEIPTKQVEYVKNGKYVVVTYETSKIKVYCSYENENDPYYHAKNKDGSYFASLSINLNLPGWIRDEQVFNILERVYEGKSTSIDMMDPFWKSLLKAPVFQD